MKFQMCEMPSPPEGEQEAQEVALPDDSLQLPVTSCILILTESQEGLDTLRRGIQRIHTESGMQCTPRSALERSI